MPGVGGSSTGTGLATAGEPSFIVVFLGAPTASGMAISTAGTSADGSSGVGVLGDAAG
jgi:hypothetical protein